MNCKQLSPRFEFMSLRPFPTTLSNTPQIPPASICIHDGLFVNSNLVLPLIVLFVELHWTTDSSESFMNTQIWLNGFVQSESFRWKRSYIRFGEPANWWTFTLKLLTVARKVDSCGLEEKLPRHYFSYAWTQSLLSVSMLVFCADWIMYALKCFAATNISRDHSLYGC